MLIGEDTDNQVVQMVDKKGKVLAAVAPTLDLKAMISDLKHDPDLLEAAIEKYIADQDYSTLGIILVLNMAEDKWYVFEGMCNPKKHTFKVNMVIQTFDANRLDYTRPPTQAMNFLASASRAKGVSAWIP